MSCVWEESSKCYFHLTLGILLHVTSWWLASKENFGRTLDYSFSTCTFFPLVDASVRTLIPLFMPGSVHSGSASWDTVAECSLTSCVRMTYTCWSQLPKTDDWLWSNNLKLLSTRSVHILFHAIRDIIWRMVTCLLVFHPRFKKETVLPTLHFILWH